MHPSGPFAYKCWRNSLNTDSHKRSGLSSPAFASSIIFLAILSLGKISSIAKLKIFASHFECDAHDPRGLGIEIGAGKKLRDGYYPPQLSAMEVLMQILRVKGMTDFGPASVRRCISARRMTIF